MYRLALIPGLLLTLLACTSTTTQRDRILTTNENSVCQGWREIESINPQDRCFAAKIGSGDLSWGGVVCYPKSTPLVACANNEQ